MGSGQYSTKFLYLLRNFGGTIWLADVSLVPRPHPAHARRRGLVSQVQILGLAPETWSGQSNHRAAFIEIMRKYFNRTAQSMLWDSLSNTEQFVISPADASHTKEWPNPCSLVKIRFSEVLALDVGTCTYTPPEPGFPLPIMHQASHSFMIVAHIPDRLHILAFAVIKCHASYQKTHYFLYITSAAYLDIHDKPEGTMCSSKLTASVLMVLFLIAATEGDNGAEWSRLYPFGQDEGDQRLDNISSPAIMLRTPFVFFHQNQSTVFVSLVNVLC